MSTKRNGETEAGTTGQRGAMRTAASILLEDRIVAEMRAGITKRAAGRVRVLDAVRCDPTAVAHREYAEQAAKWHEEAAAAEAPLSVDEIAGAREHALRRLRNDRAAGRCLCHLSHAATARAA